MEDSSGRWFRCASRPTVVPRGRVSRCFPGRSQLKCSTELPRLILIVGAEEGGRGRASLYRTAELPGYSSDVVETRDSFWPFRPIDRGTARSSYREFNYVTKYAASRHSSPFVSAMREGLRGEGGVDRSTANFRTQAGRERREDTSPA